MAYDSWDDSLEADRKTSQRSGGKKWGFLFKPTEAPTHIHLGYPEKPYVHKETLKELPFRPGSQHYIPGGGKNHNGTYIECGPECVVCAYSNPAAFGLSGVAPDPKLAKLNGKGYYGVSGWTEEEFHLVEYYKDQDKPEEGTFHKRERCDGRGCALCLEAIPLVFGNRMYMQVNSAQWNFTFNELNKRIQNRHCKCGGSICVPSFHCGGCDKLVQDIAATCDCKASGADIIIDCVKGVAQCGRCKKSWSALYTEHPKIFEAIKETYQCRCGHRGFLVPHRMCSTEGCEVDPYGVFDCQLVVRTTGVKESKRLVIEDYKIQEPDPRLFDVAHQGNDEFAPKIVEAHKKPLDLDYLLQPLTPDLQAKELGKPNPFNAGATANARKFAKYSGDEAPATDDTIPF